MFGIGHMDMTPFVYGIIMFLGIWSMWRKFTKGKYLALCIECGVFFIVFHLHGGTMAGGFAAMIAALIAGFVLPLDLGTKRKTPSTK